MTMPHFPGTVTHRQYEGYSQWQQALWDAFSDCYWAHVGDYSEMRQPAPWVEIDQGRYEAWLEKFYRQYRVEANRDHRTRAIDPGDWDDNALQYLYQTMVAADNLKADLPKSCPATPYNPYDCY